MVSADEKQGQDTAAKAEGLDLDSNAALIEEAVRTKEPRSTVRALRNLVSMRARLSPDFLRTAVVRTFDESNSLHGSLLGALKSSTSVRILAVDPGSTVTEQAMDISEEKGDQQPKATLRHDKIGQATLHNLIMRNYVESNLYEQADNFNSKTSFPEINPNETSRHLYYVGRIRAIQLEYSEAYMSLLQASRKCPQQKALGFRTVVSKWLVVVQLLMGEVPERTFFNQHGLRVKLEPYLALTHAVRLGDLAMFNKVGTEFGSVFAKDKIQNLIVRLRHNVIKAGLRMINVSYSRISLEDICKKLQFESLEATSCIVAKAIRDGVVDGIVDYDGAFLQSNETADVYASDEPYMAFKKRIRFCMGIHDDAVKAMRYPEDAHKDSFESAEERLQREKDEAELANTLAEEDGQDDEM